MIISGASAAVVLVVAILAAALVLALLIQAVRDVNVAKHTGQPLRARDKHRESAVKGGGRALFGRPLTDDEVATGKEAGGRILDDDELFRRRLAT